MMKCNTDEYGNHFGINHVPISAVFFCKSSRQDSYDSIVEILPSKIRKNEKMPLSPKQLRFGILEYFY